MGLGLLGRGVGDVEFLAQIGASLIVTDLKKAEELAPSLERLKDFKDVIYVLGEHRLEDFRNRDFILKAAGVPLDSPYIAEARKNGIPIEMDASLFFKLAPKIISIGVTGTRGKTTTTFLIYEMLKRTGRRVFIAGNIKDTATLPLLEKIKEGDIVVAELDSWQLQGFGEAKISPHIAVFTTFMDDHLNYYKNDRQAYFADKANIFRYQTEKDFLVISPSVLPLIENPRAKVITVDPKKIKRWAIRVPGEHNRMNMACAFAVGKIFKITNEVMQPVLEKFEGVAGRLQFMKAVSGVQIFNDTTATTPDATIAALKALGTNPFGRAEKKIVLIMGGSDKGLDLKKLIEEIPAYCKAVIILSGSGSDKMRGTIHDSRITIREKETLKECIEEAMQLAKAGDIILFSPAFASFGMFKNEYDRGEQFVKLVESL